MIVSDKTNLTAWRSCGYRVLIISNDCNLSLPAITPLHVGGRGVGYVDNINVINKPTGNGNQELSDEITVP